MKRILLLVLGCALAAFAAGIDGKWIAEMEMRNRGGDAAEAKKVQVVFDLKSQGDKLTGTVSTGNRGRGAEIQNGTLTGEKFSFTTMQQGQNGETKINWTGTVKGDELTGERVREGGRRAVSFTAKRQS